MLIAYLKETGELTAPIVTCDHPLTLSDVMGEKNGRIYGQIYGYINIEDNMEVFDNRNNYYVDLETKELKKKPTPEVASVIKYL